MFTAWPLIQTYRMLPLLLLGSSAVQLGPQAAGAHGVGRGNTMIYTRLECVAVQEHLGVITGVREQAGQGRRNNRRLIIIR